MNKEKRSFCRSFETPDEIRSFNHGQMRIVNFENGAVMGLAVCEPGWKWSKDVKPLAGTESCEVEHHGYCVAGKMKVRMNNGEEIMIRAGDVISIPPGHDAWVEGNESCTLLDFTGAKNYAKS